MTQRKTRTTLTLALLLLTACDATPPKDDSVARAYEVTADLARQTAHGGALPVHYLTLPTGYRVEEATGDARAGWHLTVRALPREGERDPWLRCTADGGPGETGPRIECTTLETRYETQRVRLTMGPNAPRDTVLTSESPRRLSDLRPDERAETDRRELERQEAERRRRESDDTALWVVLMSS